VIARMAMWVSTIAALVLVASFGMFAVDQARNGSKHQVAKLGSEIDPTSPATANANGNLNVNVPNPPPATERLREKQHSSVREAIDDGNDVLVSPFTGVVNSSSIWAQRGVPTLIAFLLFGVGLRILAGYLPGGARR
jgi:hypothetical protein